MEIKRNKITGAYYEYKNTLNDYLAITAVYFVGILLIIALIDYFFPEVVTSVGVWVLELFR